MGTEPHEFDRGGPQAIIRHHNGWYGVLCDSSAADDMLIERPAIGIQIEYYYVTTFGRDHASDPILSGFKKYLKFLP
jgi:hypothetical protein